MITINKILGQFVGRFQFCSKTYSNSELLATALTLPGTVGWSGIVDNHLSSPALNWSVVPVKVSLSSLGMQLNSWAPLTCREDSLAFLTAAGDWLQRGTTCDDVLHVKWICYAKCERKKQSKSRTELHNVFYHLFLIANHLSRYPQIVL